MRRLAIVLTAGLLASLLSSAPASRALPKGLKVQTYQGGLSFPVDMAWVPGTKTIYFTEKDSGRIRVMKGRKLLGRPCVDLDVRNDGERGALGIALHPKFKRNHFLYVYYTNSAPEENRVTRFKVRNNRCRKPDHILKMPSTTGYHNGGQLEFMAGHLFVSTGELHDPSQAQDRGSRLGKILRLNPDGSIPKNNPFGNAVWSYGHRNPFGLAHKPGTKMLFETENGPSCDDELNRIKRGRNYGWGSNYQCGTKGVGSDPRGPLVRWSNIIVPADPTWYRGRTKSLNNDLYVAEYGGGRVHRILMNDKATRVKKDRIIYDGGSSITDVSKGPGGYLYFMTTSGIFRFVAR